MFNAILCSICCFGGVYLDGGDLVLRYCGECVESGDCGESAFWAVNMTEDQMREAWEAMKRKWNMGMRYVSETDYRTHYINNSLAVFDEPVLVSHYTVSDCYFEKIRIPMIFEASRVSFVTGQDGGRKRKVYGNKSNAEELDFAAVADFGKYWNPTEGFFQYGAGAMAYTYPTLTMDDYDYSLVAYGAMNDGWVNPFVKNIYHFTGAQRNCYELVIGTSYEARAENSARIGYELDAYYRRYSDSNKGFTNMDVAVYVGYDSLVFKVRYVPFLDAEVVERQMGYDCGDFANDVEFFLSYQTTF